MTHFLAPGFIGGSIVGTLPRKGSFGGCKPPPPVRRTASISSTSRKPLIGNCETTGSLDNLPPPPLFLLESGWLGFSF